MLTLLSGNCFCLGDSFRFPSDWRRAGPQLATGVLHDAHWEDGLWVAVGDHGQIMTLHDGLAWQNVEGTGEANLEIVTFGMGQWLAAGPQVILTSPDGLNWEQHSSEFHFESLDYGNDIWVGVSSGRILYSADGLNWEPAEHPVPLGEEVYFQKVMFGNEGFVVIGSSGSLVSRYQMFMMYSPEGRSWALSNSGGLLEVSGVDGDFGDGRWVVYAGSGDGRFSARNYETWTSSNGVDWDFLPEAEFTKVRHGPDGWLAISYHNQTFVGDFRYLWTSPNGVDWTTDRNYLLGGCILADVIGGPEFWLELRARRATLQDAWSYSIGLVDNANMVGRQCDDSIWEEVWYQGDRWIAATQGRIISSSDALEWTEASIDLEFDFYPRYLAYQNGYWLMSCIRVDDGAYIYLRSSDTITWHLTKTFTSPEGLPDRFAPLLPRSMIAVDGRFFVYASRVISAGQPDGSVNLSGQAHVLSSVDGVEWGQASVEALGDRMSYGNGLFIVSGGTSHDIFVSEDTLSWTKVSLDGFGGIFNMEWGKDQWYAIGQSTFTSANGFEWTKAGVKPLYTGSLTFDEDQWVLVSSLGNVAFSNDGKEWSVYSNDDSTLRFGKLAFGNGKVVSANGDPYLLAGEISIVDAKLPPVLAIQFSRSGNVLEMYPTVNNWPVILETAPSPNGPWRIYQFFIGQDPKIKIRLDTGDLIGSTHQFFRAREL